MKQSINNTVCSIVKNNLNFKTLKITLDPSTPKQTKCDERFVKNILAPINLTIIVNTNLIE